MKLEDFGKELLEEVLTQTEAQPDGAFYENTFTRTALEWLAEVGEVVAPEVCHYKAPGVKLNAWDLQEDSNSLDLFVTLFDGTEAHARVPFGEVKDVAERCVKFVERAIAGTWKDVEESHPALEAFQSVAMASPSLRRLRIYILTNGVAPAKELPDTKLGALDVTHHVWDLERLYQVFGGASGREPIEIGKDILGGGIPAVKRPVPGGIYQAYIGIIPGTVLAALYGRWGQRLLERNVRSYLQTRGNINKGIQETLKTKPDMFLAYNNGISTTADKTKYERDPSGATLITALSNLQIVNGAQTTASIYEASQKEGVRLDEVFVPIKITVLRNPEDVDAHVPLISKYANSQTKVNISDFSSNHPYHIELEKLSRVIWVPNPEGKGKSTTKWYYERARGSYMNDLHAAGTAAKRGAFKVQYPPSQKLTKPLVAKYEMSWHQYPHVVSLGAEKNFARFMAFLNEKTSFTPDETHFQRLVAKAILFRATDKIVREKKFGDYKANVVTYTIAYLSHRTAELFDLDAVWEKQDVPEPGRDLITRIAAHVWKHITSPPREGMNIGEWCKKELCWTQLQESDLDLPGLNAVKGTDKQAPSNVTIRSLVAQGPTTQERAQIAKVSECPPEVWFGLAAWAKKTNNLLGWERGLAFSIGKLVAKDRPVSPKQANHALRILSEARAKGFRPEDQRPLPFPEAKK